MFLVCIMLFCGIIISQIHGFSVSFCIYMYCDLHYIHIYIYWELFLEYLHCVISKAVLSIICAYICGGYIYLYVYRSIVVEKALLYKY